MKLYQTSTVSKRKEVCKAADRQENFEVFHSRTIKELAKNIENREPTKANSKCLSV
jgi:hypothetical protein